MDSVPPPPDAARRPDAPRAHSCPFLPPHVNGAGVGCRAFVLDCYVLFGHANHCMIVIASVVVRTGPTAKWIVSVHCVDGHSGLPRAEVAGRTLHRILQNLSERSGSVAAHVPSPVCMSTTQHARPPAARTTRYVVPHADEDDSIR
eukprot:1477115-Prymnesium_polylepis.2